MFDEQTGLASEEAQARFRSDAGRLLLAGDHAAAERLILAHARPSETITGALVAALRADAVTVGGWDEVAAVVADYAGKGTPVTAIGADLSDHAEGDVNPQGCVEPGVETSYYTEDCFPFAATPRDALAAQAAGTPDWRGKFAAIDNALVVHGLASLNSALRDAERGQLAATPGDLLVGWAMLALRFQQALFAGAERAGLPAGIAVLADENDFARGVFRGRGVHIVSGAPPHGAGVASPPAAAQPAVPSWPPDAVRRSPLVFGRKGL